MMNLTLRLMLDGGILVLVIGLFFLFYDSYQAFAACVGEPGSPCSGLYTTFFVSILVTGLALTVIGIAAIVYTQLRKRRARNETIVRSGKTNLSFLE